MYLAVLAGMLIDRQGMVYEFDLPTQDCLFSSVEEIREVVEKYGVPSDELEIVELADDAFQIAEVIDDE